MSVPLSETTYEIVVCFIPTPSAPGLPSEPFTPFLLTEQAQKDYLIWYYTNEEYGNWKQCGKCGEVKLAHPFFFSKNTSKDGFYSVCKECRGQNK